MARPALRVAFLLDSFRIGGTELNAVRTMEQLNASTVHITACCLQESGPLRQRYVERGICIHHFPIPNLYSGTTLAQARGLGRFLLRERIDVLHAHDVYANIFGVPSAHIVGVGTIASRRWWKRLVRPGLAPLNRLAYRLADRVLANTNAVATLLTNEEGVPGRKVRVVANFVESDALVAMPPDEIRRWRTALGIPSGVFVVGTVGRLAAVKDQQTLIRALVHLADVPNVHTVIVGDGELREELGHLAVSLGLAGRVHFTGYLPNRPNPHQLFDLSVLCSLSEGFPNSILEGMAASRAVVATAVGGVVDAVREWHTGLLVPPSRPDLLAGAIRSLVLDDAARRDMGTRGRRDVEERYTVDRSMDALVALYDEFRPGARNET